MTVPGRSMAIEDAVVLAKELALVPDLHNYDDVEAALRAYERNRMPRSAAIIRESWQLSRTVMNTDPLRAPVQELFLRLTPESVWRRRGEADAEYEA